MTELSNANIHIVRVFIYADEGFPSMMEIIGLTKCIGLPSRTEISIFQRMTGMQTSRAE